MIDDNIKVKVDEFKFDASWKQGITLSDDEASQQQIVLASDEDDDEEDQRYAARPVSTHVGLEEVTWSALGELLYLDEPGLQMFVTSEPDISSLFLCFFPKGLFDVFQGNLNNALGSIIRKDNPQEAQFQALFAKKRFGDTEVSQYLGMTMLFGVFRFPTVTHYWHADTLLKGGIEICMQEGRFKFIENNMFQGQVTAVHDIRRKWRKMYRPDQELILYRQTLLTHTIYYLIDSETLYILDEVVTFGERNPDAMLQMLMGFSGKNHVNQVYCTGEVIDHDNFLEEEGRMYCNQRLVLIRNGNRIQVIPKSRLVLQTSVPEHYKVQNMSYQIKAQRRIDSVEVYKNPFSYTASVAKELPDAENGQTNLNEHRILFEEYLEVTIYNMFTFFTSILINHSKNNYKTHKLAIAGCLIGDRYMQLERDRKEIIRRATMTTAVNEMQTEKLSFGLPETYDEQTFHYPVIVKRTAPIKYCVVCMKYENLSKSYFQCLQCQKQIQQQVFLCVFPCFELYHRNPTEYLEMDKRLLSEQTDDRYYRIEQGQAANLHMEQEYQQRNPDCVMKIESTAPKPKRPPPPKNTNILNKDRPNAKYAPSFYNWSYNRGFKERNEDVPIEKDFEDVINNLGDPNLPLPKINLLGPKPPKDTKGMIKQRKLMRQVHLENTGQSSIIQQDESEFTSPFEKFMKKVNVRNGNDGNDGHSQS